MRILLLHSSSDTYGASKIFLQTVALLKNRGHNIVIVLSNKGSLKLALEEMGIDVQIVNLGIIRRQYFNISGVINRIQKWLCAIRILNSIVQSQQIDLIYSNTASVLVGGYIAKRNGIKHIWHIHEIIEKPAILHHFLAWRFKVTADKLIVVSKAVEKHWQHALPLNKIVQIYNGIEPVKPSVKSSLKTEFKLPENALVIGMASRVHYWKGQSYFVEIARELLSNYEALSSSLFFLIAGDPFPGYEYLLVQLKQQLSDPIFEGRVFYVGFVNEMDIFYRSIDLLILPSQLPDPFPTVILEAMQYGIPVAATKQGGALEIVKENETGILIPLDNAVVAAEKIQTILSLKMRYQFGEAAKQRVANYFSQTAFEKKVLAVVENELK